MTEQDKFNGLSLDKKLLSKSPNNHKRRAYVRSFITEELLRELVERNGFSSNYICKQIFAPKGYFIAACDIIRLCRRYGIKTLNCKEQANNPLVRERYRETCLKKYGTNHVLSKGTRFYRKRNNTVRKRYGVSNVFQLKKTKTKARKSMMERYGVANPIYLPDFKRNSGRKSKIQEKVEAYLLSAGIHFESEVSNRFLKFNKYLNKDYCPRPDILIENSKLIIEVYGDKWHGNPKLYKSTDIIKVWGGNLTARKIHRFDIIRKRHLESFGYKVLVVWERDIRKNFERVKKIINEAVGP